MILTRNVDDHEVTEVLPNQLKQYQQDSYSEQVDA